MLVSPVTNGKIAHPEGLDGQARRDLFGPASAAVATRPPAMVGNPATAAPYTEEEEALITKYLTDLGYLG